MSYVKSTIKLLVIFMLFSACEKNELEHFCHSNTMEVRFSPSYQGQSLLLNDSVYDDYQDRKFRVEMFKFYLSHLMIENELGELVELNDVSLVDFSKGDFTHHSVVERGVYSKLHFAIGLDSLANDSDPSLFDSEHPLSISQNTHWSWASKYKFLMLEGRVDTLGNGDLDGIFSYHTGFNSMYREIVIPLNGIEVIEDSTIINIEFDLNKLVNGASGTIDFVEQSAAHSELDIEIFQTLSDNLLNAFTLN